MEPQDLKAWRALHNLTQATAAEALGIGRRTLVGYEQGEASIPRSIELACMHLTEHPIMLPAPRATIGALQQVAMMDALERGPAVVAQFQQGVGDGKVAGVVEYSVATYALLRALIWRLREASVIDDRVVAQTYEKAIELEQSNHPSDAPWRAGAINMLQLAKTKAASRKI